MFPIEHITNPENIGLQIINLKEIKSHVSINELLESIVLMLSQQFTSAGLNVTSDNSLKEGALVVESIRALLSKHYRIHHPFHELAYKVFDHQADGSLRLVNELKMK